MIHVEIRCDANLVNFAIFWLRDTANFISTLIFTSFLISRRFKNLIIHSNFVVLAADSVKTWSVSCFSLLSRLWSYQLVTFEKDGLSFAFMGAWLSVLHGLLVTLILHFSKNFLLCVNRGTKCRVQSMRVRTKLLLASSDFNHLLFELVELDHDILIRASILLQLRVIVPLVLSARV